MQRKVKEREAKGWCELSDAFLTESVGLRGGEQAGRWGPWDLVEDSGLE